MTKINSDSNQKLASSCQTACSACCKKGKIFLTPTEFEAIWEWTAKNSSNELHELDTRTQNFGEFLLYDQKSSCQFLRQDNLCRLHDAGVKPKECFWWPLHVYLNPSNNLEIRVSTTCCDAYEHIANDSSYTSALESEIKKIKPETFKKFREIYPGSYAGIVIKDILE